MLPLPGPTLRAETSFRRRRGDRHRRKEHLGLAYDHSRRRQGRSLSGRDGAVHGVGALSAGAGRAGSVAKRTSLPTVCSGITLNTEMVLTPLASRSGAAL